MSVYVVLAPDAVRGVYGTWPECEARVRGVAGAVYRKARTREEAEAFLRGEGRRLGPGTWAFVDGNEAGGVGVVLVHRNEAGKTWTREIATHVGEVLPGLVGQLAELRNVLSELAAIAAAAEALNTGTTVTVVHDYEGTGHLLTGRWKARHPGVRAAVAAALAIIGDRRLTVRFMHVNGHQSAVGGDEFALYNGRADRLAREGARRQSCGYS
jgi:ribonuclease HI